MTPKIELNKEYRTRSGGKCMVLLDLRECNVVTNYPLRGYVEYDGKNIPETWTPAGRHYHMAVDDRDIVVEQPLELVVGCTYRANNDVDFVIVANTNGIAQKIDRNHSFVGVSTRYGDVECFTTDGKAQYIKLTHIIPKPLTKIPYDGQTAYYITSSPYMVNENDMWHDVEEPQLFRNMLEQNRIFATRQEAEVRAEELFNGIQP
ncbi:hypothetical protein [Pasteurella testudinis]|uniref:hypothetical protein n=1 Tax=Pasteurella testudinis TaxID=761 RepID=UPI004058FEB0